MLAHDKNDPTIFHFVLMILSVDPFVLKNILILEI